MAYYNQTTDEYYSGGPFTITKPDESTFYGIPTIEQLIEWGFEEYTPPVEEYEEEPIEEPTDEDEITAEEALDIIVNG